MNDTRSEMDAPFIEVAAKKIEEQNNKITELEEKVNKVPNSSEQLQYLIKSIEELKTTVTASQLPTQKLQEFIARLTLAINLLQQPVKSKVEHHHHIPKIIWITAGLFVILSLVCSCWYMTADKVGNYIASDTKYRYLLLDSANRDLQKYLYSTDSLYRANPDMRKKVIETEAENKRNLQMLQQAKWMEKEAKELKRKVYKK